jgi:hypothetical protein
MNFRSISLLLSFFCVTVSPLCAEQIIPNHPKIELPAQTTTHEHTGQITGKVLESMNSGGYSYIRLLQKGGGKVWVAVPEARITVGEHVSFREGLVMTNFQSKTLRRTFDRIIFSNGIIPQPKAEPAGTAPKDLSVPPIDTSANRGKKQKITIGSQPAVTTKKKVSVARAKGPNAYTIEQLYKDGSRLNGRNVVVRGKVVKASSGIMKRTWIHLQDGTGSQAKGTHNLVCTTRDTANVGDIITVRGTLANDRDFGFGYRYRVILENAVIKKREQR